MHTAPSTRPITSVKPSAIISTWLAPSRSFWPLRRATSADTDTFSAMKRDRAMNLGWVVRPTEATAAAPRVLTISESIKPARATNTLSITAGQAMSKAHSTCWGLPPNSAAMPRGFSVSKGAYHPFLNVRILSKLRNYLPDLYIYTMIAHPHLYRNKTNFGIVCAVFAPFSPLWAIPPKKTGESGKDFSARAAIF